MQENRLNKFRSIVSEVSSFMSYTLQFEFYFNEIKINQDFITSDTGCPNKQLVSVKKYQNVNCKTFCDVPFLYRSFSFQNSTPLGNQKINKHVLKSSRRNFYGIQLSQQASPTDISIVNQNHPSIPCTPVQNLSIIFRSPLREASTLK